MTKTKSKYYRACDAIPLHDIDRRQPLILERELYNNPGSWFETREEAVEDFLEALPVAEKRSEIILREFNDLKERLGFNVGHHMEGDTHGIYEDYQYIDFNVDGYDFHIKIED